MHFRTSQNQAKRPISAFSVISKIRAKWSMVIIGDTVDPNFALCIHMIH